jgi:hypothetical protein
LLRCALSYFSASMVHPNLVGSFSSAISHYITDQGPVRPQKPSKNMNENNSPF